MLLLTYGGAWVNQPARHPEAFVELAPEPLQDVVRTFGGSRNHFGDPLYRLVRVDSRYFLGGGLKVAVRDNSGNIVKTIETEALLPRFHVGPEYHSAYALEMWHPPQWFYERGFGQSRDMEYGVGGNGVRCAEPVWADGAYEPIWNGMQTPFVLPRQGTQDHVRWMMFIAALLRQKDGDARERAKHAKMVSRKVFDADQAARKQDTVTRMDFLRSRRRAFLGEPMISFAGT